ncbi:MutS-related protein [Roseateles koreensis]|uniref:DNA mismatch repair proteins mutS family domain-containing protein n=1 Tax=Roseateles koreensis TaxID=2987526 RepID=A0ABT5KX66_9BURK|nr:hypothetical protein [Roseateles koreensis]MDC8786938.1 hypothetical protein [Roseateles koreensis]
MATPLEIGAMVSLLAADGIRQIDDQTWKDLDLDCFTKRASQDLSVTGQIFLHLRLRNGGTVEDIARFRTILECSIDVPVFLDIFTKMRAAPVNICTPLFVSNFFAAPALGRLAWIPIPLLAASMLLLKFSLFGWLGVVCSLTFSALISIRLHLSMKSWHQQREVLLNAIVAARLIRVQLPGEILSRLNLPTENQLDELQSQFRSTIWGRFDGVAEYANLLFLTQYTEMYRQLKAIKVQKQTFRELVKSLSAFEADLGILNDAQKNSLTLSLVGSATLDQIVLCGLQNPLLPSGAPMSIEFNNKGMLLTGKNGIGKSTLLRTIGISVVLHRAFGVAYANQARIGCNFVMSSMRIDDSLVFGDSSHVAEAKRIRDMIAFDGAENGCLYIIDEVFNATNYIEAVAAAVPALYRLANRGLLLVSTHNLIYVPLLRGILQPMKLEAAHDGFRILENGVMGETNGLDILEEIGFDERLVRQSRLLAARLEEMLVNPDEAHLLTIGKLVQR